MREHERTSPTASAHEVPGVVICVSTPMVAIVCVFFFVFTVYTSVYTCESVSYVVLNCAQQHLHTLARTRTRRGGGDNGDE